MSEYVPTTREVLGAYAAAGFRDCFENQGGNQSIQQWRAEADRWLAAHDRTVIADYLDKLAEEAEALRERVRGRRSPETEAYWQGGDDATDTGWRPSVPRRASCERMNNMIECTLCRDWGKYERHEDKWPSRSIEESTDA